MRTLLPLLVFAIGAFAGDASFNGRWNIKPEDGRTRAWWLEVNGAGTKEITGKFVGAPGGDCDVVRDFAIRDGELSFSFTRGYVRVPGDDKARQKGIYRAKLVDGKLDGSFSVEGFDKPAFKWTGTRAAVITDKDDGTWVEAKPIKLFNGRNLKGWMPVEKDREFAWRVKDGLLTNMAAAPNIISERKFWNFKVHMEYRIPAGSNSGLGLRGRYEVQIADSYGKPVGTHMMGALYSRIPPSVNASKPEGEWQTLDVTLIGRDVTVTLNDTKVIDKQVIEGPTAVVMDTDESAPGPIFIQGDHREIEVRSVVVTPLVKAGTR
jgi:hypothetical protein